MPVRGCDPLTNRRSLVPLMNGIPEPNRTVVSVPSIDTVRAPVILDSLFRLGVDADTDLVSLRRSNAATSKHQGKARHESDG